MSLEATVRKAQANSEQVVFIFFDMGKACHLTWSHGILMDINEAEIEGRMFNLIQNFFKPISFKINVNEIQSDAKVQTEGIPQERVVSPKLFILKVKKIVALLPKDNRFQISLYMEDLQISYRHQDWRAVEKKLLDIMHNVEKNSPRRTDASTPKA